MHGGSDPAYWVNVLGHDSNDYREISHAFTTSAEYKATFADMNNAQVVSTVYERVFGRAAEQAGFDYWANLLDKDMITVDNVVTQVTGGALTTDLFAYNAKVVCRPRSPPTSTRRSKCRHIPAPTPTCRR